MAMWQRFPRPSWRPSAGFLTATRSLWALAIVLGLVMSGALGYYLGHDQALNSVGASPAEVQLMRVDNQQRQRSVAELQRALSLAQQERDLAVETARKMQEDSKGQMDELSALREQMVTYQRMLGGKGANGGLAVENIRLSNRGSGKYGFRLLLTQVSQNTTEIGGTVLVRVLGAGGQPVGVSQPFRFQYFQAVSGELALPGGFVPQSIEVTLQATGKKAGRVQKRFKWEVGG
ncbi:MAG: hypothetical protein Q7T36_08055 [Fluviicoccus sp.]|uniref:DUF6776 family protein n=1 Tax=Fluviicoccus sp. TaxID=2003552 RepID=UPI00272640CB|nr:DUF6776 family protein [Fluviicoccus sp.]MDO8330407.1 hypothetical protein [Fluviicoccus sp.]